MQAGSLRHRVSIQSASEANSYGEVSQSWSTEATMWGEVRPLSGRELDDARQRKALATHAVTVRGDSAVTITPKKRILFGARVFSIEYVIDPDERGISKQIQCVEAL
jgi:SPP1 family predicted phage head-tail adaptor